jgi:hypothetical protein
MEWEWRWFRGVVVSYSMSLQCSYKLLINTVGMIVKLRLKYMEAFVNQIRPGSNMFNERTGSVSCRHTNRVECLGKVNCLKLTWLSCGESPCHKQHMTAWCNCCYWTGKPNNVKVYISGQRMSAWTFGYITRKLLYLEIGIRGQTKEL